jgi:hypothetical protein
MKFKHICFIVVPLIFFGCGAYHYMHRPEEGSTPKKMPENKQEIQQQIEKHRGRKG